MAGELVSFRYIVDGRTCFDWYVLNVDDIVGKDRGVATVEVGGCLNCCSTAQQFGRFVTLELKTGEHPQRPTAGSAFAVLMSSPARGGSLIAAEKRSEHRQRSASR